MVGYLYLVLTAPVREIADTPCPAQHLASLEEEGCSSSYLVTCFTDEET